MSLKSNYAVENKYGAFYTGGKIQISDDGIHMFCQCDAAVKVVTIATGKADKTLEEDEDDVTNFILSPDNEFLIVAYKSLLLRHWDWKEGKVVRKWKSIHMAPITSMSYDVTSTLLATGSADATVKVWDTVRKQCTNNLRDHTGVISLSEFHPDIARLQVITAAGDNSLRVWSLQSSTCEAKLDGHYSAVTRVQFSIDGQTMYSAGRDSVVMTWCLTKYERLKTIPVFESLEGLLLLPPGIQLPEIGVKTTDPHFVTAGSQGLLKVWNATRACCVHEQQLPYVYSKTDSQTTGGQTEAGEEEDKTQKAFEITDVSYNKTMDTICTVTFDHNILMYSRQDFSLKKQFVGYTDEVTDVHYVTDAYVAMATNSELLKVQHLATGQVHILRAHHDVIMALGTCQHGHLLASAGKDGRIFVWQLNPEDGAVTSVASGQGHTSAVTSVAFSHLSASFLVTGSNDLTLKLWDLPGDLSSESKVKLKATLTERAHDKDINSVAVSPNDKLIASASVDKTVKVWSADGMSLLGVCRGHTRGVWCVKFSTMDQCIATGSGDGTIKMWALSDYSCVKTFEGHDASVLNLHFLSRAMQILSTGSDGLIKLWTLKSNECVKTWDEHGDKAWALAVNSTEDRFITGGADSVVIEWKDVTELEEEEARAKQEDVILKEQEIQNLLHQKKYLKALKLAINMDQPFRVFNIIKDIMTEHEGDTKQLDATLVRLKDYQIDAILRYAVRWNTNSKNCHVAQHVISVILTTHTIDDLLKLGNFRTSLEGLIPYTERHMQRMKRLQQQSTFVDYTWQCMRLVTGASYDEEDAGQSSAAMAEILGTTKMMTSPPESSSSSSSSDEDDEAVKDIADDVREECVNSSDSESEQEIEKRTTKQNETKVTKNKDKSKKIKATSERHMEAMECSSDSDDSEIDAKIVNKKKTKSASFSGDDSCVQSDKENKSGKIQTYTALKNKNKDASLSLEKSVKRKNKKDSQSTVKRKQSGAATLSSASKKNSTPEIETMLPKKKKTSHKPEKNIAKELPSEKKLKNTKRKVKGRS